MGRSCVVTGAASGIGLGIMAALVAAGWSVVAVDLDEGALGRAIGTLGGPGTAVACPGDVADPATHRRAADAAEAVAPLAAWVNCAGYNILGSVAEVSVADLERGVAVNLLAYFHGTGEAVRRFLGHGGGAVVNISSVQGLTGFPGFAAYSMCKGGINALTRQVAAEFAGRGIRCNAIAPGVVSTPINDKLIADSPDADERRRQLDELSPVGRWGRPEDVAAMAEFLVDPDRAGFITGQVIQVDGGATVLARGQRP